MKISSHAEVFDDVMHTEHEAARLYRKIAIRIVPLLLICYIISYLDRVNLSFAKLHFLPDLGLSEAVYGIAAALFYVTYVLFEVPSNLYMQRVGVRATLVRIMLIWGAVTMAMSLITTPNQLYIARLVLGAAEAGFFPGVILYLSFWFPSAYRARITSLFIMGIPISGMIGGPLAGWIMHDLAGNHGMKGWQLLFLYEGLPPILLGLFAFFYLNDRVSDAKWLSNREKAIVLGNLRAEQRMKETFTQSQKIPMLKDFRVYAAILAYFAICCGTGAMSFWMPTLIKGLDISDVRIIGWLSAIPYLTATVGLWIIGRHSDRTGERRWHVACCLIASAIGFSLLGSANGNAPLTISLLALAATGLYGAVSVFWSIPTAYFSKTSAAGGIALVSSMGCIGGFASTVFIGWIKGFTGSVGMAMGAVGVIMVIGALVLLIAYPASLLREKSQAR
jgi:ACS family phthalate transporter-like MFS transporter